MDLVAFQNTMRYQRVATPDEIARDVQELAGFDGYHERRAKVCERWVIGGVLGLMAGLLFTFLTGHPVAVGIAVAGLGTIIGGAVRKHHWSQFDLVNERYQALGALVQMVKPDLPDDATLDADVELRPPSLVTRELERGAWKCKVYVQPWLRLRGRFVDGTRFEVKAVERREVRTCWKRGRSGKMKSKRKERSAALLDVSLSPQRAGDLSVHAERLTKAVQLPKSTELVRARAEADALSLRARVPGGPTTKLDRTVAMMMLSLYQVVGFARTQQRGSSS